MSIGYRSVGSSLRFEKDPTVDALDLSRWQFGITTVYHYIFVPLTIGLGPLLALMQTFWLRSGKEYWYRATRFFGTIFLINFAIGVATGIVQEFQFGMNWSEYSKLVGDVFGGPLALEALIAFFLESVFLGVWIFGWGKIPAKMHTAAIWIVAISSNISAYFIVTANTFMQNPNGAWYNPETRRAELENIVALLFNPLTVNSVAHTICGALLVGSTFILGVSCWWLVRSHNLAAKYGWSADSAEAQRHTTYRPVIKMGMWATVLSAIAVFITGDIEAKMMFVKQPMKMAAAEGLCHTETDPMFSIFSFSSNNDCASMKHILELPLILPFLAEGRFKGVTLHGIVDLQNELEAMYGPGDYSPNLFVTYWSFRIMIGMALGSLLLVLFAWIFTRKGRVPQGKAGRAFAIGSLIAVVTPFLANLFGWIFTEMGRYPWIVYPNGEHVGDPRTELIRMKIEDAVSDHSAAYLWITVVGFTLLYAVLYVGWYYLLRRAILLGPPYTGAPDPDGGKETGPSGAVGAALPMDIEPVHFGIHPGAGEAGTATDTGYDLAAVSESNRPVYLNMGQDARHADSNSAKKER